MDSNKYDYDYDCHCHHQPEHRDKFVKESFRQNEFWLRIMQEHALFIRLGLPCDETHLIHEAIRFENLFRNLREDLRRLPPRDKFVRKFNDAVIEALGEFIEYKSKVLKGLITCRLGGSNFPLLIDHIRREAIRFRVILVRLQKGIKLPSAEEALQEEIFWLRIMGEHAHFIAHLLDPSERPLVKRAFEFAKEFETLRLQAEDLESMEVPQAFQNWLLPEKSSGHLPPDLKDLPKPFVIPRLARFNNEAIGLTKEIRDFKQTALKLIEKCEVLSIIPPLLADHVLREARMAIEDLEIIGRELYHRE
ncbi:MAG: DUF2935 domain-containing protein [Syntrophomonadaceae bacterium]|nr:DUF2935 domain-containing protein [Syntrophomonadaceae bacterium]